MAGVPQQVLEAFVGTTFIIAGGAKLVSRSSVAPLLNAVGLPFRLTRVSARLVPAAEIGVGLGVIAGGFPGVVLACLFSLAFAGIHLLNRRNPAPVVCNCFGRLDFGLPDFVSLVRMTLLAFASAALAFVWVAGPLELAPHTPSLTSAAAAGLALSLTATLGISLVGATVQFRRDRSFVLAPRGGS